MGTISDKLLYLNETKEELRDGINDLVRASNEIDEDDTFRSYVEPLKSIRDRLPKVEGEGENITLDDTIEARIRKTLNGNTSQVQYSGKNLLKYPYYDTSGSPKEVAGVTWTDLGNGGIKANGTPSGFTSFIFERNDLEVEPSTQYTIGGTRENVNVVMSVEEYDENSTSLGTYDNIRPSKTFTTQATTKYLRILIKRNENNIAINNEVFYPILVKGATLGEYEPYVGSTSTNITPSPNPSYPQDIHSVSGDNEIEVCGKNLFDKDDTNIIIGSRLDNLGVLNYDSVATDYFTSDFIKVNSSTSYYINEINDAYHKIAFYTSNSANTFISKEQSVNTFTTPSTANYLRFCALKTELNTLQLEKGTTASSYSPYTGNTYPIYLPVENLFDKSGTIINGYFDSSTTTITSATSNRTAYCRVKPNTTYCISKLKSIRSWVGTSQNEPTIGTSISNIKNIGSGDYDGTKINGTITTGTNDNYIVINYTNTNSETGDIPNIILDSIQVEKGTKPNHYTPYGTTPIRPNGINDNRDGFVRTSGKNKFDLSPSNLNASWDGGEANKVTIIDSTTVKTTSAFNNWRAKSINIPLAQPNTQYTLTLTLKSSTSAFSEKAVIRIPYYNGETLSNITIDGSTAFNLYQVGTATFTFTTPADLTDLGLSLSVGGNDTTKEAVFENIQLELGATSTSYEPYGTNEWWVKHEIGEVVLDGSENWNIASSIVSGTSRFYYDNNEILNPAGTNKPLSNMFKSLSWIEIYRDDTTTRNGVSAWDDVSRQGRLIIRIDNTLASSVATFKTWLSANKPIVYFVLSTPTYTKVTDDTLIEQLDAAWYSQDGQTNIGQENNDQPFWLEVDALKDSDLFH